MIIIGFVGCIVLLVLIHIVLKDVLAPPFILSVIWTITYLLLILFRIGEVSFSSAYYLSFLGGLIFFSTGFFMVIGNRNISNTDTGYAQNPTLRFKLPYIQIFLLVVFILFLVYLTKVIQYISKESIHNAWHTLSTGKKTGEFIMPVIIEYSKSAVIALNLVCSIVFFNMPSKRNKRYFLLSGLIALFYVSAAGNRGSIFMWIVSIAFSYLIIKRFNNRKLLNALIKLLVTILIIFIITNFAKYVYRDQTNPIAFSQNILKHYFTSPPIAFVEWMKCTNEYLHGANTFRFFLAIFNSIGGNINVEETVQTPIVITSLGEKTNVYTILHYYAADFGLIYAFIILILIGALHGFFYKKTALSNRFSPFYIAMQSLLYFPLLYQFFSDQYLTILSSWIQLIFWIWIFSNRSFLYKSMNSEEY